MLTFEEYSTLEEDAQIQLLSAAGVYLELTRNCRGRKVELYALYDFYVEIFFDGETEEPLYIKYFNQWQALDPYLNLIDISGLLGIREGGA